MRRIQNSIRSIVFFAVTTAIPALAANPVVSDPQFNGGACAPLVTATLDRWKASRVWTHEIDSDDGIRIDKTASEHVGVWIESRVFPDGRIELRRISPQGVIRARWPARAPCISALRVTSSHFDEAKMRIAFTDADLKRLLRSELAGLLYFWSPHMPYSINGLKNARAAAGKIGVKLHVLMDPRANRKIASKALTQFGIGKEMLKPVESIELLQRGVGLHYPSAIAFYGGKLRGALVPGLQTSEYYASMIRAAARRDDEANAR